MVVINKTRKLKHTQERYAISVENVNYNDTLEIAITDNHSSFQKKVTLKGSLINGRNSIHFNAKFINGNWSIVFTEFNMIIN